MDDLDRDPREASFARELVAERDALRERVATLEDGIRVHKAGHEDCGDADCGCVTSSDRRLWSFLDGTDQ